MDCFIQCFKFICKENKKEYQKIEACLYQHLSKHGLNLYTIHKIMNDYSIDCSMYRMLTIPKISFIAYFDYGKEGGHFVYVLNKTFLFVKVYDPNTKIKKVFKLFFYLKWSKIGIFLRV